MPPAGENGTANYPFGTHRKVLTRHSEIDLRDLWNFQGNAGVWGARVGNMLQVRIHLKRILHEQGCAYNM